MNPTETFRGAMKDTGLDYGGPIAADGSLHRFKAEGDHNANSWYILYPGPPIAGAFGCWKRDINLKWCEKSETQLSRSERESLRRRWDEAAKKRELAEIENQEAARAKAEEILNSSVPVTAHAYLQMKGVPPCAGLREKDGALVVPLRDIDGMLHSLQFIDASGQKRFLTGGRVKGCLFTVSDKPDGPLVVCEGVATGLSIHEATGMAVVAAMNCSNLIGVAQALRTKFPKREFIMAADNDQWTEGNPGTKKATEAAKSIGAKLAIPVFKDTTSKPSDFNDLFKLEGRDEVWLQIQCPTEPKETTEDVLRRLSVAAPIERDRLIKVEAKRLGCKASTLEREVSALRSKSQAQNAPDPAASLLTQLEPDVWPEEVDGSVLLSELADTLNRFAVFRPHAADALALFILETYAADRFDAAPYIHLASPEKRCGKSLVLRLLSKLCARALAAGSCSESAIFRSIEATMPTLLIDEVDTFFAERDELRGILNTGCIRDDAHVLRTEQLPSHGVRDFVVKRFSVFCPKVFAGIGKLADTLADRCIVISMRRKRGDETRERFRRRKFDPEPLRQKCRRWANDHGEELASTEPELPDQLNDRAADVWEPLLAVAAVAGTVWLDRARAAALALSGENEQSTPPSLGCLLLADVQAAFAEAGMDRFSSAELCDRLAQLEERPWGALIRSKPINPNKLARILAPYGISSRKVRLADGTRQGYLADDFCDAWERYLPGNTVSKRNNGTRPVNVEQNQVSELEQETACSTLETAISTNAGAVCSVVPLSTPDSEGVLRI